jgi:hypothetical protein
MTNPFRPAALLCRTRHDAHHLAEVRTFLDSLRDDDRAATAFYEYCARWKLAPWVSIQLERTGLGSLLPTDIMNRFREAHNAVRLQNEARNEEARRFLSHFADACIPVIILKGNLFAQTLYGDTGYKRMNDFDIMVRKEDWPRVRAIYASLDYLPLGNGWSGEKEKPASFSHTALPFISRNLACIIGTQWGLKSPTAPFRVDTAHAWANATPVSFNGIPVFQLSPEYNLLHLILHMGIYKCGIRDCMDVYNLLLSGTVNEEKAVTLIRDAGAEDKAVFTLEMCRACIGELPGNFLQTLQPRRSSFLARRLRARQRMIADTGDLHHSYNDYFQDIEKNLLYLQILPLFHHKLVFYGKILGQVLWPRTDMTLRFLDRSHRPSFVNRMRGRVTGPWFAFSMIAEEIGWPVTALLFGKLFADVLLSPLNYLRKRGSYFDFLRSEGINPGDIKKIVANVQ